MKYPYEMHNVSLLHYVALVFVEFRCKCLKSAQYAIVGLVISWSLPVEFASYCSHSPTFAFSREFLALRALISLAAREYSARISITQFWRSVPGYAKRIFGKLLKHIRLLFLFMCFCMSLDSTLTVPCLPFYSTERTKETKQNTDLSNPFCCWSLSSSIISNLSSHQLQIT